MHGRQPYHRGRRGIDLGPVHVEVSDRLPRQQLRPVGRPVADAGPEVEAPAGKWKRLDRAAHVRAAGRQHDVAARRDHEDRRRRALGHSDVHPGAVLVLGLQRQVDIEPAAATHHALPLGRTHLSVSQGDTTGPAWGRIGGGIDVGAILAEHLANRAVGEHLAVVQPDSAWAGGLDGGEIVRHEDERRALSRTTRIRSRHRCWNAASPTARPRRRGGRRLEERGDREAEPHLHAARIELHLPVDRVLELRERDDVVEPAGDLARLQPDQRAVQEDVLPTGEVRVDAGPHLDQRAHPPGDIRRAPPYGIHDPRQDLQQRGLAGAVRADETDGLARLRSELDVAEGPAPAAARAAPLEPVADALDLVLEVGATGGRPGTASRSRSA